MADENILGTIELSRGYLLQTIAKTSDEQLLIVPEGANNNILWNLGHLALSHAGLTYGPCELTPPVPENYGPLFKGGTSPSSWDDAPSVDEVKECFHATHSKMLEDYRAGVFDGFKPKDLMPGVTLNNVEQAFGFNCIHEGVHIGTIISILNLMGAK